MGFGNPPVRTPRSGNGSLGAPEPTPSRATGGSRKKNRRRLREKELDDAARERRRIAHENYAKDPRANADDIWVCEFCEYERIFGEPPVALIRDYEVKDRRARREKADRKRLLEKARAKSRKTKKSGKGAATRAGLSGSNADQTVRRPGEGGRPMSPLQHGRGQSTQSEEDDRANRGAGHSGEYAGPTVRRPPDPTTESEGGDAGTTTVETTDSSVR